MSRQLELPLKTWGGRRKGAGRKPKGDKAGVSHLQRPKVTRHSPVHVTLRLCAGLPSLRRGGYATSVKAALAAGKQSAGFALVHYSIQSNHLHLIVEAAGNAALSRGMKALSVRVARTVNRERGRSNGR
jgi:REP element-mobilizing transposase RayT